jgi:hypothetical protein
LQSHYSPSYDIKAKSLVEIKRIQFGLRVIKNDLQYFLGIAKVLSSLKEANQRTETRRQSNKRHSVSKKKNNVMMSKRVPFLN